MEIPETITLHDYRWEEPFRVEFEFDEQLQRKLIRFESSDNVDGVEIIDREVVKDFLQKIIHGIDWFLEPIPKTPIQELLQRLYEKDAKLVKLENGTIVVEDNNDE